MKPQGDRSPASQPTTETGRNQALGMSMPRRGAGVGGTTDRAAIRPHGACARVTLLPLVSPPAFLSRSGSPAFHCSKPGATAVPTQKHAARCSIRTPHTHTHTHDDDTPSPRRTHCVNTHRLPRIAPRESRQDRGMGRNVKEPRQRRNAPCLPAVPLAPIVGRRVAGPRRIDRGQLQPAHPAQPRSKAPIRNPPRPSSRHTRCFVAVLSEPEPT